MIYAASQAAWLTVLDKLIDAGPAVIGLILGVIVTGGFFAICWKFGGKLISHFGKIANSTEAMSRNMKTFVERGDEANRKLDILIERSDPSKGKQK